MPTPTSNAVISKLADSISGLTEIVREWIARSKWVSGVLIVGVAVAVIVSFFSLRTSQHGDHLAKKALAQSELNGRISVDTRDTAQKLKDIFDPTSCIGIFSGYSQKVGRWASARDIARLFDKPIPARPAPPPRLLDISPTGCKLIYDALQVGLEH